MMNDPSDWGGGKWHGAIRDKNTADYTGWEHNLDWGREMDSGMKEEKKERRKCRERDCKVSLAAVLWKVPERAYTSPASLFFTRQAVLGTFSRSVASASCQSKQRACFVKPKVKLRSNEGTALTGGTSSIILPRLPAERTQHTLYVQHSAALQHRRRMESCRGLSWYFQICRCMAPSMPHVW